MDKERHEEGYQTTEDSAKTFQRLKDKMQDDKKVRDEIQTKHPKYFIQNIKPPQ